MEIQMVTRIVTFFLALFSFCAVSFAGELRPYDKAAFDAAIKAGQPVVVHVHADWCSTCKKQQPTLVNLVKDGSLKDGTLFIVDYDKDREFLQAYKVRSQSTILVFKGGKESARLLGTTDAEKLRTDVTKAL
jgi:thioredoxin 1